MTKKHKYMNWNYYQLVNAADEVFTYAFSGNDSRFIEEKNISTSGTEDWVYIIHIESPLSENDVKNLSGIEEITDEEYNIYTNNLSNYPQFLPGSRPPHRP